MNISNNYSLLIDKLDQFIRKFYLNQLIRGGLYFTGLTIFLFLAFNILEYYFNFGTAGRKMMFYSFLGVAAMGLLQWIIGPMIHYFSLGKTISHEDASKIIGSHFVDVEDKLLNILHLKKQEDNSTNRQLLLASIEQKTEAIKLVPFKSAIDLSKNKRYLRYALPPVLMLVGLLFAAPSVIKDSTYRILNNDREFEKPAPFSFAIKSGKLEVPQFEDFSLDIKVEGSVLPNEVFVEIDGFQYKAEKIDNENFTFLFRNVQKDTKFNIVSGTVRSISETLEVIKKPNLNDFKVVLNYPVYTGREKEVLDNIGDMIVPEGTVITWNFEVENTDLLQMKFDGERPLSANQISTSSFSFKKSIRKDHFYQVLLKNDRLVKPDSLNYSINVTKDQHPIISVETFQDSTDNTKIYFAGNASDDYGISNLTFHYTIVKQKGGAQSENLLKVERAEGRDIGFEYGIDVKALGVEPGDNITYYFQVADNDAINGAKTAKTGILSYRKPSIEELKEKENENEETIKDNLKDNIKELEKLQEQFRKMRDKILQEKQLDWQSKKELEKLLKEQEEIQKKIEENKKLLKENMKNQQEMEQQPDPEIQEKQERMQELMNESLNQEQKEMMEKIQELMQELEKDDALEMMQQMEMNNENKNKDMKRLLELYKQLEMEKEVKDQLKDIKDLAKKQEDLAKKTEEVAKKEEQKQDQTANKEDIAKKQDELNKKMEELMKKQQELEKKNKELSPPKDLGKENKEKMEDAKKEMEDAKKELEKKEEKKEDSKGDKKSGDSKKAAQKQKQASKKMQDMADEMESSMEGEEKEQQAEDIKMIRQLLENLVTVSFDQERLSKEIASTPITTPKYVDLVKQQFKLKNDFTVIEDSLTALAQRVDKIESFVTEKVTEVKYNIGSSIEKLEDRQTGVAVENQRRTMKNLNDLANMLAESMKNMQQQMSGSMPGSQACEKPGGKGKSGKAGKVPMDKITQGQQGVDESMKGMSEKIGKGEKPSAKDFAEAAAKQAAARKALEENARDKQEQGKGAGNQALQEIINQMDKLETELVNKRFNAESMKRQKDILTRLLEAEKAERQREMDEKRKSESAEEKKKPMPPALQEYLKKRQAEAELFKTTSPALKAHYKNLVDEYYKALKSK
jgi:hypothetical protein